MASSFTWKPSAGSLPARVAAYLGARVDEELTHSDMKEKFGATGDEGATRALLSDAVKEGWLERKQTAFGAVWKAGVLCPRSTPAAAAAATRKIKGPREFIDPARVVLEEDIPLPAVKTGGHPKADWTILLLKMIPGKHSAVLPTNKKSGVDRAIKELRAANKGDWIVRRESDPVFIRVWRTAGANTDAMGGAPA